MLHLARKAFWPAPVPFPLLHVDTGHNFPEVIEYRDRVVAEHGLRLVVASVQDAIDDGRVARAPRRLAQPAADRPAARRASPRTGSTRCSAAGAATRRRPAPRSGCSRLRDEFGQWDPRRQRPELWDLYNGRHRAGEHVRVFPLSNWTELDVWRYIERESIELPVDLLRARARGVPARRHVAGPGRLGRPARDGEIARACARSATARSATCAAPAPSSRRATTVAEVIAEVARQPAHRARRHPRRRPGLRGRHGRPQARGVLLMSTITTATAEGSVTDHATRDLLRLATAGSVDDGKSTLVGRLLYDTKSVLADQLARRRARRRWPAAAARSTSRCSPTACAPSASRASRSTSRTGTSRRPRARSSSPTPPGTCSTRATWSPAPRPPSWRSCWSTPARACSSRPAGTRRSPRCCGVPHVVLAVNKMDLVDFDEATFARDRRGVRGLRASASASPTSRRSRCRRSPATTSSTAPRARPGTTGRRCSSTSSRCRCGRDAADRAVPVPRAVRHPPAHRRAPRLPRLRRPGRVRASCASATRSSSCPSGRRTHGRRHRHVRRPARPRRTRRSRSRCGSPTTSTSPAATSSCPRPTTVRRRAPTSRAPSAGWPRSRSVAGRPPAGPRRHPHGARRCCARSTRASTSTPSTVEAWDGVDTLHAVDATDTSSDIPPRALDAQRDRAGQGPARRADRARRLRHAPAHRRVPAGRPRRRHHARRGHDRRRRCSTGWHRPRPTHEDDDWFAGAGI